VVALGEVVAADDIEDRRVRLKARRVEVDAAGDVRDARKAARRVFERHAPHESVHLVAEAQQVLGQVAAVLASDARD
jgi:hypothetical protein